MSNLDLYMQGSCDEQPTSLETHAVDTVHVNVCMYVHMYAYIRTYMRTDDLKPNPSNYRVWLHVPA